MTTTRIALADAGRIGVRCFLAEPGEPELIETLSSVYGRLVIGGSGCELCGRTSTFREFPKRRNVSSGNTPVDVTVIGRFGLTEVDPVCAGAGWASFHHRPEGFA